MATDGLSVAIERRYPGGPTIHAAFEHDRSAGQVLVLFGPSGSGKTTVLRCLAGLARPDAGRITMDGIPWLDVAAGIHLAPQRRRIGYMPQGYALFPHLTVRQNIAYGVARGAHGAPAVGDLIARLGLRGLEDRRPGALSGGQQQRVALGRALARDPALLLLDEPLAALDTPTRESLRLELRHTLRGLGTPAIMVTHDRTEALMMGDRIGVMIDGRIRQLGVAEEVFNRPADADVARATGVESIARGMVDEAGGGTAIVRVGTTTLRVVTDLTSGTEVVVSIRPEDVLLMRADHDPSGISARNHLVGTVTTVDPLGPLVRVGIDAGFPLIALVTRQAFSELGVGSGLRVAAVIKAPSIHLIVV